MGHNSSRLGRAARAMAGLAVIAAAGTAVYTVRKIRAWSKDEESRELWLRGCCGRGIVITKGNEPNSYDVRVGSAKTEDVPETVISEEPEPEMELDISQVNMDDEA